MGDPMSNYIECACFLYLAMVRNARYVVCILPIITLTSCGGTAGVQTTSTDGLSVVTGALATPTDGLNFINSTINKQQLINAVIKSLDTRLVNGKMSVEFSLTGVGGEAASGYLLIEMHKVSEILKLANKPFDSIFPYVSISKGGSKVASIMSAPEGKVDINDTVFIARTLHDSKRSDIRTFVDKSKFNPECQASTTTVTNDTSDQDYAPSSKSKVKFKPNGSKSSTKSPIVPNPTPAIMTTNQAPASSNLAKPSVDNIQKKQEVPTANPEIEKQKIQH